MIVFRIMLVAVLFGIITYLFKKASGSLRLSKMNMISALYYFILIFNLIGASLIYLGFRDHYLIKKIDSYPKLIDNTYYMLAYSMIMFPLVLLLMKRLVSRFLRQRSVDDFIDADIHYNSNMVPVQGLMLFFAVICTGATIYVFSHLGYIPLVAIIKGQDLDALRQSGGRFFSGNQYIKNLLMVVLTPYISYLSYAFFRTRQSRFWLLLFIYMAILSVIALTYDFSKSPVITYLLGIYLLEVVLGRTRNNKRFRRLAVSAVILILVFYCVAGAGKDLFSIYKGPVGRIVFTQIATLFLHVAAFPQIHPFLQGASFNSWMSTLIPAAEGLRSGRVVMTIYNPTGVQAGTAGVMNTVFIGEAYANFGMTGIIVAPIIFGVIIGFFAYLLPSVRKSPLTILLYVQLTLHFSTVIEGGFVDIFYSASLIFLLLVTGLIAVAAGVPGAVKKTARKRQSHPEESLTGKTPCETAGPST